MTDTTTTQEPTPLDVGESPTESGFALNWRMRDGHGAIVKITMRSVRLADWADALRERKAFMDGALKAGWQMAGGAGTPSTTPAPTSQMFTHSQPEGVASGKSSCAMIEVATGHTSGKTQLVFHCDGHERPLRYTKALPEMVKLLAPLGIGGDRLVVGKKLAVNASVVWRRGEKYTDVLAVEPGEF